MNKRSIRSRQKLAQDFLVYAEKIKALRFGHRPRCFDIQFFNSGHDLYFLGLSYAEKIIAGDLLFCNTLVGPELIVGPTAIGLASHADSMHRKMEICPIHPEQGRDSFFLRGKPEEDSHIILLLDVISFPIVPLMISRIQCLSGGVVRGCVVAVDRYLSKERMSATEIFTEMAGIPVCAIANHCDLRNFRRRCLK